MKQATFTEVRNHAKQYFDIVESVESVRVFRNGKPISLPPPVSFQPEREDRKSIYINVLFQQALPIIAKTRAWPMPAISIAAQRKARHSIFKDSGELRRFIESLDKAVAEKVGRDMLDVANRRYTWRIAA